MILLKKNWCKKKRKKNNIKNKEDPLIKSFFRLFLTVHFMSMSGQNCVYRQTGQQKTEWSRVEKSPHGFFSNWKNVQFWSTWYIFRSQNEGKNDSCLIGKQSWRTLKMELTDSLKLISQRKKTWKRSSTQVQLGHL